MTELFQNSTGYKRLDVYILMNIIQLETLVFCRRFLDHIADPCGRQFDQMTQAARSGVKNLTEGCERRATSMQTTLKLLDVAKASLCELRDDYLTWLLDLGLPPWPQRSAEAQEVYAVRFDAAAYGDDINYELAKHIIAQRSKFVKWLGGGCRQQSNAIDCTRKHSIADGVTFANVMLILIGRALHMLDRLLKQLGEEFIEEGGFSERMTAARIEKKRAQGKTVNDDAPACPKCGGIMRIRHGQNSDFWGCVNYPTCKGTREIR